MEEMAQNASAFATFRVLNGEGNEGERDQLFRNMAQLFSHVSERCDDEQVVQYDKVLCQLADLVEEQSRAHVAGVLSKLDRAPGQVVVKLAHDTIEVAQPLLAFSNVLSDDDLIEIINEASEDHRVAIAGREHLGMRVGDAIVDKGGQASVVRLIRNNQAEMGDATLKKLAAKAQNDPVIAQNIRGRTDIDWNRVGAAIAQSGQAVLKKMGLNESGSAQAGLGAVSGLVYQRIRNRAGFNANDWKLSWNQVKALADRRQLDKHALARFVRFGYGHHAAAGLTLMMKIPPEVLVKWLATQDYVALTIACKAQGLERHLFEGLISILPWRDFIAGEALEEVCKRFDALSEYEAGEIFNLWRAHAFRNKRGNEEQKTAIVA